MIAYAGPQLRAVLRAALVCSKYIVCAVCICFMYYNKGGYKDPPGWYLCVAVGEGCVGSAQKQRWDCCQSYVRLCV